MLKSVRLLNATCLQTFVASVRSKSHIEGEELLDFLKDAVAAVPALPPEGAEPAKPKPKRQR